MRRHLTLAWNLQGNNSFYQGEASLKNLRALFEFLVLNKIKLFWGVFLGAIFSWDGGSTLPQISNKLSHDIREATQYKRTVLVQ